MSPANGDAGSGEQVAVERVFISAGCNRIVNNVSWSPSGLVSFGAQNAVAIFCPESAQILTTLPGHKAVVNCTEWVPNKKDLHKVGDREIHYLLSGSSDGAIILWEINPNKRLWNHVMQLPQVHKRGVTCITSLMISENIAIFASTSSDGIVLISELTLPFTPNGKCQVSCLDSISVGNKPMVALSLSILPNENNSLLLAMAGLDQKIHIYYSTQNQKFTHACELKGHSDWIRGLDFSLPIFPSQNQNQKNYDIYLASSSQDKSIRIWKLSSSPQKDESQKDESQKDEFTLSSYTSGPRILTASALLTLSLESLLLAHEDWVYSVQWHPSQQMSLLSASMDKTMMIWRPERNSGIWMNVVTVGELASSSLGFYGGDWGPDGRSILGFGYGGAFHVWRDEGSGVCEEWKPTSVPSGHFGAVFDLGWGRDGEYLVSVSHDQTTRIFSPWRNTSNSDDNNNNNNNKNEKKDRWHEIARPQVHGHDINCLCVLEGSGNHRFVSGADEKVARVFEAPISFLKTLNYALAKEENSEDFNNKDIQILGANMSALGLSQKPIYSNSGRKERGGLTGGDSTEMEGLERIPEAIPTVFTSPPVEDQLSWNTLWPESHKLYGHGNELFSLCCNRAGTLVASSCKAQTGSAAEVLIWEVGTWKAVARLRAHTLTVTQLEFSYDDKFLLAVSRDRQLSVFSINKTPEGVEHELIVKQETHKRIIWACAWTGSSHEFATGSRDKTVKIWSLNSNQNSSSSSSSLSLLTTLPQFKDSVTALAWMSDFVSVGMDNGLIEIWRVNNDRVKSDFNVECVVKFDPFMCHVASVYRLRWKEEREGEGGMRLASCGADHSVRVFDLFVK
ncbi:hypothetical protein LUZ60_003274 [Juncus effusus]|nr:hypothetical protein LUZ60_003274 [Juncus effusus]